MKYAVVYQSKSGNTEKLANQIYDSVDCVDREIINIDNNSQIPEADVYFVGFGVHNNSCSMGIAEILKGIRRGSIALFATCGFTPTDTYKEKLENELKTFLSEGVEYLGMFLCQGKVENDRKNIMISKMPHSEKQLKEIFSMASTHPDKADLDAVGMFVKEIADKLI